MYYYLQADDNRTSGCVSKFILPKIETLFMTSCIAVTVKVVLAYLPK